MTGVQTCALPIFGDEVPPAGEILAIRTANLDAKDALLALGLPGFFTIEHFTGYPAVLVALKRARVKDVRAAVGDAFATLAPMQGLTKPVVGKQRSRTPRSAP